MWGRKRKQEKKTDNVHPVQLLIRRHTSFDFCPVALSLSSPPSNSPLHFIPLPAETRVQLYLSSNHTLPVTPQRTPTRTHTPLTRCKRHVTSVLSLVGSSRPRPQPRLFPSTREEEDEEERGRGIGRGGLYDGGEGMV